jgi:hypothetical protein
MVKEEDEGEDAWSLPSTSKFLGPNFGTQNSISKKVKLNDYGMGLESNSKDDEGSINLMDDIEIEEGEEVLEGDDEEREEVKVLEGEDEEGEIQAQQSFVENEDFIPFNLDEIANIGDGEASTESPSLKRSRPSLSADDRRVNIEVSDLIESVTPWWSESQERKYRNKHIIQRY